MGGCDDDPRVDESASPYEEYKGLIPHVLPSEDGCHPGKLTELTLAILETKDTCRNAQLVSCATAGNDGW